LSNAGTWKGEINLAGYCGTHGALEAETPAVARISAPDTELRWIVLRIEEAAR
jgi:hypothetical protein